ncbi:uncharacterized protein LOC6563865 [Drosophila grimshawi]|uniref:GH19333 n=1 Tax=Drosophila grimshawi TaxID=7222 RepID=B4JFJ7_DROGR|nr:uncharacterized protein LOC6563865 [Drosophila grimshawi]EDV93478.1 GH19333 [Drosophila grimshawi]
MSTTGRKRKQQLKPRQDVHRSPVKRQSLDVKTEPLLASSYPLADYDCVDIKPDLTELQLQLQLAVNTEKEEAAAATTATTTTNTTKTLVEDTKPELEQQSDSDEDGYSEINFGAANDVFCDDEADDYDPEWTSQPTTPRLIFKFNTPAGQTGLRSIRKLACPRYYFNQLLGNRAEFFAQLAKSCRVEEPASADEMETFVGLCLLLSDVKLAQLSDYWTRNMYPGFMGFAAKMSLLRFQQLLQSLSFEELPGGNADMDVGQAGKLIGYYNARMSELYVCGQQLVLNEPIIHWKQQFSYQQELPPKQRCNALMLHLLSEHSGLILRILPELQRHRQLARNSRQLVAHRNELALQLLQTHLLHGHSVYVCKYYGSYGLAHELARLGTYCSGLLDRNRYGNSKALVYQQLTANSIATRYAATPLMMAKWRRREKCVYFYSSDCLAIYAKEMSMQKINARPKLIQELDFQLKPAQSMRQLLISYQPSCAGLERQQQLCIYLLNLFVFNAHVLYVANAQPGRNSSGNASCGSDPHKLKTYAEFRMAIIKSLLKEDAPAAAGATNVPDSSVNAAAASPTSGNRRQEAQSKRAAAATVNRLGLSAAESTHALVLIQRNGKALRKNCRHCHKGGMLQFTKYMCNLCPDTPGLCVSPCFRLWHEQQQLKQ